MTVTKNGSTPPDSSNASDIALVVTACAVGILMTFLVYSGNFIFGSIKGIWMYRYFEETSSLPRWIPLTALILIAITIIIGKNLIHTKEKTAILISFLFLLVLQFVLRAAYPYSLGEIVASNKSNSFYTPALQYTPLEILRDFEALSAMFPSHARTNMPGKILFFEFLGLFTTSPEIAGALTIFFSSLGGVLLYSISRKIFDNKIPAFYALILYMLIPCRIFFVPLLNTITPIFMLILFSRVLAYVDSGTPMNAWLVGGAVYLMVLFEPSPLVTGLIPAGLLLYLFLQNKLTKQDIFRLTIHAPLSFFFIYLFFRLVLSFDLLETLRFVLGDATHFNQIAGRDYRIWFGENLKEFFYSVGTPVMVIFIFTVIRTLAGWDEILKPRFWSLDLVFSISLLATFSFVVLLGINRGEISRLWIYLAVLFQVPAAGFVAKINKSALLFFLLAGTMVVQTLLPLHRVGFVVP